MMRFKKGSKVEVLCKKEVSFGAWRCAEIIVESGKAYKIRCEATHGTSNGKVVDGVPSMDIRPSPPRVEAPVNWATGDVLEVLDDGSWKTATVLKVLEADHFLVRILGSFEEFKVHMSKTRLRQTWKDDKWVALGKAYGSSHEFAKCNNMLDLISSEVPQVYGKEENNHRQDSYIVSAKSLKRASPFYSSYVDAYPSKVRAIEDRTRDHRQVASRSQSTLILEIVDDDSTSQQNSQVDVERESSNGACSCYLERSSASSGSDDSDDSDDKDNDTDTDTISVVDSCSVYSGRMNKMSGNVLAGPGHGTDADTDSSDAESFCGRRCEEEEEASRIHELELNAYRSTVAAIHASGPLSWEREELLTNLRITLHISHDEHLSEVRNLIACGNPSSLLACNRW